MFDFIILLIISIAIIVACVLLYLNFTPSFIQTPIVEPTLQSTTRPIIQPTVRPIVQPTVKPTVQSTIKAIVQPTTRPIVQSTVKPVTQPTAPQRPVVQPTQRPVVQPTVKPNTNTGGSNPFVNAINSVFLLQLGSNSAEDSCAARHAAAEPTLAQAHTVWKTGDRCNGGRGAVWSGSPNPDMAAKMWLNSPPHASIIRGATRLACGAGPSSAVCIAY